MAEAADNHYQVLRIERTADERAIKKAYFSLIREFPPDTHPEEFKRIRAAYETLSDPVARQRFDAVEKDFREYGDEVGAALREIEELTKSGNDEAVQRKLKALLEERPDLIIARENLGFSYLRAKAFKEALAEFSALADKNPAEARYHLYKGLAFNRLEQPDKALASVEKAHQLKPDDLGIHLAFIDVLKAQRKLVEAVREIDLALEGKEAKSEQAVVLGLRRVDAIASLGSAEQAEAEVTGFFELVRQMNDPELPKYVSSQLAATAARLYARDDVSRANAVLRRCEEIYPESPVDHPYPIVTDVDRSALPEAGQAWLARQTPGPNSPVLAEAIWTGPVFALLGASLAAALTVYLIFDEPKPWGMAGLLVVAFFFGVLALAFGWVVRAIRGILSSPLRAFTTVHPLYLLRVRGDRIRVHSLFNLSGVRAVHHHTNGAYTNTQISLSFGTETVNLAIRGKDFAQGWLQYLVGCRQRSLELMMEGYLEAEHGVELIPPALLTSEKRRTPGPRWGLRPHAPGAISEARRFYGGAAAVGLAAFLIAIPWHAKKVDDWAYRLAVRGQTIEAYTTYLVAYPEGRHAEDVKQSRARIFKRAADAFRASANEGAPGAKGILAALSALEAAGVTTIPVTVTHDVKLPGGFRAEVGDAADGLTTAAFAARASDLVGRVERTLSGAGLSEVMRLKPVPAAEAADPVTMSIRGTTRPDGNVLRTDGAPAIPSIAVDWEVVVSAKGTPEPLLRFTTTSEPPPELRLEAPRSRLAPAAFTWIEDAAFDEVASMLAIWLGLPGAAPKAFAASPISARKVPASYAR